MKKCKSTYVQNKNDQKGITLIALIITIIILLILTMVAIKIVTDSKIIDHAENAANLYQKKQDNELEQLNLLEKELSQYGTDSDSSSTSNWWQPTAEELEQIYFPSNISPDDTIFWGFIATKNVQLDTATDYVMLEQGVLSGEPEEKAIVIMNNQGNERYLFFFEDYELNVGSSHFYFEKQKWYFSTNGATFNQDTVSEYTGASPIQLTDYSDDQIYCKTYLERVINSFNH